jgi:hypothetical protein
MTERLYTLKEAQAKFLPGWSISALRTEIRRGRLVAERIAGKLGVTEQAIGEMRQLCREKPKVPVCTYVVEKAEHQCGSSSTEESRLSLAAAKATIRELKQSLRATSRKNTSRRKNAIGSTVCSLRTL